MALDAWGAFVVRTESIHAFSMMELWVCQILHRIWDTAKSAVFVTQSPVEARNSIAFRFIGTPTATRFFGYTL